MAQIEAIGLDFSGVLADSRQAHTIARKKAMQSYRRDNNLLGITAIPDELHDQAYLHGDSSRSIIAWLLDQADIVLEPDTISLINTIKKHEFAQLSQEGLPAIDGAIDYVRWVSAKLTPGRIGIASRSSCIESFLQRQGIEDAIGHIVDADQTLPHLRKPHPYVYTKLALLMGVSESKMMSVDDSPDGIMAARAAGTFAVGIATTHPRDQIARAHMIVNNFSELQSVTREQLI